MTPELSGETTPRAPPPVARPRAFRAPPSARAKGLPSQKVPFVSPACRGESESGSKGRPAAGATELTYACRAALQTAPREPQCANQAAKSVACHFQAVRWGRRGKFSAEPGYGESSDVRGCCKLRFHATCMFQNPRHYAVSQIERSPSRLAVHQRRCAFAHRGEKGAQFRLQWLFGLRRQFFKINRRLGTLAGHADARYILPRVINRNIFTRLEKTQFAHALRGNTARGQIRHRARLKFNACMRDIYFLCQHGNTHGMNVAYRRVDEPKQNIQVMNHHVEHHIHVQAARRKNSQAVHLEKQR